MILIPLLLFTGCYGEVGEDDMNIPGTLPELLRGEWFYSQPGVPSRSERYIIDKDTVEYGYGGGESEMDYAGNIRFVSNYSADSGVIIIEYTVPPTFQKYNGNSFFGIYYRNLKNNTVQLANAINADYSSPDTATLEEAIEKFTRLKMGNYVDWGVVQPQNKVR